MLADPSKTRVLGDLDKMASAIGATVLLLTVTMVTPRFVLNATKSDFCIAPNNKTGICVHESLCNEEHIIMPDGVIEDSEFRNGRTCPKQTDWCCTADVIPPPQIGSDKTDKCLALDTDICPWCVLLYKVGDVQPTARQPYCLGALIGPRIIITASTCLIAAQKDMLYAQVPNSAHPGVNYTVIRRQFHPDYNTGSHAFDFGILVLKSDVMYTTEKSRGACLDFEPESFGGECVAYGIDIKGKITSTVLEVTEGACHANRGASVDAACGSSKDDACFVTAGSPVLCKRENQDLLVGGIARHTCNNYDKVLMGGISYTQEWFEREFDLMNITKNVYIHETSH